MQKIFLQIVLLLTCVIATLKTDSISSETTTTIRTAQDNATIAGNTTAVNTTETTNSSSQTYTTSTLVSNTTQTNTLGTATSFVTGYTAQLGEYQIQIDIICKFNDTYISAYNNLSSQEYQIYTNKIKMSYVASPVFRAVLRLIDITFISLSPGSVIVNMQLNVASYSADANTVVGAVVTSTNQSFPYSSIVSLKTTYVALIVTTLSPLPVPAPNLPEWAIALISIAMIGVLLIAIISLTAISIRIRGQNKALSKSVQGPSKVGSVSQGYANDGMILETWNESSNEKKYEIKETSAL